ncbi:MAG TPA: hypothetical protein VES69_00125 [Pyrinomonadaceae bacterium]|nr:hypothetical protein [Pyrinomonadaceae bacterium]
MSNEELDRRMEFIIEQQAQFASDILQLREAQAETEQIVARTSQTVAQTSQTVAQTGEIVGQTGEIVTRLARGTLEGFKDVNAKIDALVDSQIRTDENVRRTDENVRRTDESLLNLIAVVDRYISQDRNGH